MTKPFSSYLTKNYKAHWIFLVCFATEKKPQRKCNDL